MMLSNMHASSTTATQTTTTGARVPKIDPVGVAAEARSRGPKVTTRSMPSARSNVPFAYESIEGAATRLAIDPNALRARCRRAARRVGRDIVAYLGAGIEAFKFGRSWRVRFPIDAAV